MTKLMVELYSGYGDGYGVVKVDDQGESVIVPGSKATHYTDQGVPTGIPIEGWKRKILAAPGVVLEDAGVRVPPGAIRRVIGPLDCPEAVRVRARRYTKNWGERRFVDLATDAELAAAMAHESEHDVYAACAALKAKYAE